MHLGRIIGTLTPCMVYKGLEGVPMLIVEPLDKLCKKKGSPFIAADPIRMCGKDELIYYESSREAALACDPWFVPVDHAIIGIVDDVNLITMDENQRRKEGK